MKDVIAYVTHGPCPIRPAEEIRHVWGSLKQAEKYMREIKGADEGWRISTLVVGETLDRSAYCQCDMRTKLEGDGCAACNPEMAKDLQQP